MDVFGVWVLMCGLAPASAGAYLLLAGIPYRKLLDDCSESEDRLLPDRILTTRKLPMVRFCLFSLSQKKRPGRVAGFVGRSNINSRFPSDRAGVFTGAAAGAFLRIDMRNLYPANFSILIYNVDLLQPDGFRRCRTPFLADYACYPESPR